MIKEKNMISRDIKKKILVKKIIMMVFIFLLIN